MSAHSQSDLNTAGGEGDFEDGGMLESKPNSESWIQGIEAGSLIHSSLFLCLEPGCSSVQGNFKPLGVLRPCRGWPSAQCKVKPPCALLSVSPSGTQEAENSRGVVHSL